MEVSKKQEILSGEAVVSPDTKSITVNIVEPNKQADYNIDRYIGRKVEDEKSGALTTYVSTKKAPAIFLNENTYLRFTHHNFVTDDVELKRIIESSDLYGTVIFKESFPDWAKKQMEEERRYITRDSAEFE
jgi:Lhr-like helicase